MKGSDELLRNILSSFLQLAEADLSELVTGRFSNFPIHAMLNTGSVSSLSPLLSSMADWMCELVWLTVLFSAFAGHDSEASGED